MSDKSEKSSGSESQWSAAWMDLQKKYWDAFTNLTQQATQQASAATGAGAANPWSQSADFWSRLFLPSVPPETRSWVEKTLELNRGYQEFGESLWKTATQGANVADAGKWWDMLRQNMSSAPGTTGASDPWAGFATFWGLPMDNWRRVVSACSTMPGDMEKALQGLGAEGIPGLVNGWLSTPTLGYTREWQQEQQRLAQLWLEHGEALQRYNRVLGRVVERASELLRERFTERVTSGTGFDSMRSFYNTWVDCGEEAYAEIALSDEFTSAQAGLTNTLMAVKRQEQKMVDETLSALNMPTRRELDTSHRRLHQLQRQVWKMADTLADSGVADLRDEVAALRREVEDLRRQKASAAAPEAPAPAPVSRRRTAPK